MKKTEIPPAFATKIDGDIVTASYSISHKGSFFGSMCEINKVTGDVSVAMPQNVPQIRVRPEIEADPESFNALKMLTEALSKPEREFVVVNEYEIELDQELLHQSPSIRRVANLDLLNIALGTITLN
ncbi:hypothetical protein RYA05_03100 [Pseudomonas syringae pv. actinidiae]|nr:hypothetical protein [Pseudomonas syringae pv. actinidiae]